MNYSHNNKLIEKIYELVRKKNKNYPNSDINFQMLLNFLRENQMDSIANFIEKIDR
jgi:hypothetical protein